MLGRIREWEGFSGKRSMGGLGETSGLGSGAGGSGNGKRGLSEKAAGKRILK